MVATQQTSREETERKSAILLLLNASFFIIFSMPETVLGWLSMFYSADALEKIINMNILLLMFLSRCTFSLANCTLFALIGGSFRKELSNIFSAVGRICKWAKAANPNMSPTYCIVFSWNNTIGSIWLVSTNCATSLQCGTGISKLVWQLGA